MKFVPALIYDIALAAIIFFFMTKSYRKGLVTSIIRLAGVVIAYIAGTVLSKPITSYIYTNFLEGKVSEFVSNQVPPELSSSSELIAGGGIAQVKDKIVEYIEQIIEKLGIDPALLGSSVNAQEAAEAVGSAVTEQNASISAALTDTVVQPLVIGVLNIIVFIIIFAVTMFIVKILARAMRAVNHVPIVGPLNRLGGAVLGAAEGLIICYIIGLAAVFLIAASKNEWEFLNNDVLSKTHLLKWFTEFKLK